VSSAAAQFFRSKPLACDPASLPKLPPSKEYDAKLRGKEAAMRQNATAAIGGKGSMSVKPGRNEQSKAAAPAQDAVGGDHQVRSSFIPNSSSSSPPPASSSSSSNFFVGAYVCRGGRRRRRRAW
jgi:hypothetical protein